MIDQPKVHSKKCGFCGKPNTWEHGNKHKKCVFCGSIEWDKPKEECILFNLQEEYLKTRDQEVLGKMYLVMYKYAQKIILKQLPYRYDETKLEEKTEDAVTTIIRYYLTKPDYKILYSFGSMLFGPTRQELFKKKQQDIDKYETSYDIEINSDNKTLFKDQISSDVLHDDDKYTQELVNLSNTAYVVQELSKFTNNIYLTICKNRGVKDGILALLLLHHFLNGKKETFFDEFYNEYGTYLKDLIEGEKLVLLEYIKEMSKNNR
mgnify:CR=1 FL=1